MKWNASTPRYRWSIIGRLDAPAIAAASKWCAARPEYELEVWPTHAGCYLVTPTVDQSAAVQLLRQIRCFDTAAYLGVMRVCRTPHVRIK